MLINSDLFSIFFFLIFFCPLLLFISLFHINFFCSPFSLCCYFRSLMLIMFVNHFINSVVSSFILMLYFVFIFLHPLILFRFQYIPEAFCLDFCVHLFIYSIYMLSPCVTMPFVMFTTIIRCWPCVHLLYYVFEWFSSGGQ